MTESIRLTIADRPLGKGPKNPICKNCNHEWIQHPLMGKDWFTQCDNCDCKGFK